MWTLVFHHTPHLYSWILKRRGVYGLLPGLYILPRILPRITTSLGKRNYKLTLYHFLQHRTRQITLNRDFSGTLSCGWHYSLVSARIQVFPLYALFLVIIGSFYKRFFACSYIDIFSKNSLTLLNMYVIHHSAR